MDNAEKRNAIESGRTALGVEFGSTRIKAVLVAKDGTPLAQGGFSWENKLVDNNWTYSLDDVKKGLGESYKALCGEVWEKYGVKIKKLGAIGISAMMHGYLAFDKGDKLLVPFRTWRNTTTEKAANELTDAFSFNIPQRWSIAHLYQAMLNREPHVPQISYITTLAGYVHYLLTGEKVLGIGDASGMFPIDSRKLCYNKDMLEKFDALAAKNGYEISVENLLPRILLAGDNAGVLTKNGALLLDASGELSEGVPFCAPEGDAGTGMVATNSVAKRTGNVSAGTSIFAMAVLEKPLQKLHTKIDMVTTPSGAPVAMVHCNNCTSDINAWAELFCGFSRAASTEISLYHVLDAMFSAAENADDDCGGLVSVNFLSGEPVTDMAAGVPMFLRGENSAFTFENFSRAHLYSAISALKIGMDILTNEEKITLDKLTGHGGFFKSGNIGAKLLAGALKTPVSTMETAGEGGAWGIAVLALYSLEKDIPLEEYLSRKIFASAKTHTEQPRQNVSDGFERYLVNYKKALGAEKAAVEALC